MASVESPLHLAGDRRCDSPRHCALYGSYTLMDVNTHLIVASELVKVIYIEAESIANSYNAMLCMM